MGELIQMRRRHELLEGDVVQFSGTVGAPGAGPLMLVAIADAEIDDEVTCIWIVKRRLQTARLRGRYLALVARPEPHA